MQNRKQQLAQTAPDPEADERFKKLRNALRQWMLGRSEHDRSWIMPLRALDYAETFHTGTRKDGKTPAFLHQIEIALMIRTLSRSIDNPPLAIACALLHDVCEDADVGFEEIEALFGRECRDCCSTISKKHRGTVRDIGEYAASCSACQTCSIVKLADRAHNLSTMEGAFSPEKQAQYCAETRAIYMPMLKTAKRRFPSQEPAYENLKSTLTLLLRLGEAAALRGAEAK